MKEKSQGFSVKKTVRARVRAFVIPPIRHGLLVGTKSPIGCEAIRKALNLLTSEPFHHIEVENDDVIQDIIIRSAEVHRLGEENVVNFVLKHVKGFMSPEEILDIEINTEIEIEEDLE